MKQNPLCHTPRRAWFYLPLITSLATLGLSVPRQADEAPVQLSTEQSGAKYGAFADFCDEVEEGDYTPPPSPDICGWGYSNNHASQEEANQQALKKCGVSGCKVIQKYTNACVAIAEVSDTWEYNGRTIGYWHWVWSEPEDALKYPVLSDLENFILKFCNSYAQEQSEKKHGYTFKPCQIVESSCPTPVLSLIPQKERLNCGEAVTLNVSGAIGGEWIPVINGVENPPQSASSFGPFKGCSTSWNFYLKHALNSSVVSNTVNLTWKASNSSCEFEWPSFDGSVLRIPKLKLNNGFREAELNVVPGNPIRFELSVLKNEEGEVIFEKSTK